jgi:hypothetical protein
VGPASCRATTGARSAGDGEAPGHRPNRRPHQDDHALHQQVPGDGTAGEADAKLDWPYPECATGHVPKQFTRSESPDPGHRRTHPPHPTALLPPSAPPVLKAQPSRSVRPMTITQTHRKARKPTHPGSTRPHARRETLPLLLSTASTAAPGTSRRASSTSSRRRNSKCAHGHHRHAAVSGRPDRSGQPGRAG